MRILLALLFLFVQGLAALAAPLTRDEIAAFIVPPYALGEMEFWWHNADKEAALRKTRKQLLQLAEQWGDSQRQYLEKHSASVDSLLKFRRSYCLNNDFNPILFGEPLRQSCDIIEQNYDNLIRPD